MENTVVSVIIPTYNDWDRLSLCLTALANQILPGVSFEIIVVNNNGSAAPADINIPENCKIIDETRPGSYAARNTGIKNAVGEIIAFTDSDCIPDKYWLSNAVQYLKNNPDVGRIAGAVELFYKSKKLLPVELYEKIFAFDQERYATRDNTAVTANLITYKSSFDNAGLFNDALLSGGDNEWSLRAQIKGITIKYAANVVVYHPARSHVNELVSKAKRVGGGQAAFTKRGKHGLLSLLYDLRPPLKSIGVINKRGADLNLIQKSIVFSLRYYLSVITAYEKFRVLSGKAPRRE